jgi:cellulose synthase/poly-beta-1,6-N-acetylglucosamine synthase-like glycosyltransferase/glucan phosphoethanolaminetransferase (alkaline phosphatase superfamily)
MTWQTIVFNFITYTILIYSVTQLVFYILIGLFSIGATKRYANKNSFIDYKLLAVSPYAPSISILAPSFNEGANIIENVRSLLSIYYNNLEVIIINDGSKDNSMEQLVRAYNLEKVDYFVSYQIETKKVKGVYKSRNPIYKKLVVVDKVNGGKADALNVGINVASNDYIVCIDVDCVLEQDALLKLMKPFLETTDEKKVIATGGVVRIANSCNIQHGRLLKVNLPKKYLPRMQALEYIRAFLLGRMAWSRFNGLLLISGAFGAFNKEITIKVGGYNPKTVGEDMELLVRMRRYMEELKQPYRVAFIPDPLCWTEAPSDFKILGRQRNRWTRGTIETLLLHIKMFFNPKYRLLGLLSYPYWFFFEMCAPGVEFLGFAAFLIMAFFHLIYWQTFFAFLAFIVTFGYLYSAFAIYMEVKTYNQYKRRSDVIKLLLTALTEPFVFHPFIVWSGVRGYVDKMRNKSSWGEMTRQGFNAAGAASVLAPIPSVVGHLVEEDDKLFISSRRSVATTASAKRETISQRLKNGIQETVAYSILLSICMILIKAFELIRDIQLFGTPLFLLKVINYSLINELAFVSKATLLPIGLFMVLFLLSKKFARFFFVTFSILLIVIHAALAEYFLETLVPLGADLWSYSLAEIKQTIGAAGKITFAPIMLQLAIITALVFLFIALPKKIRFNTKLAFSLFFIFATAGLFSVASYNNTLTTGDEASNSITLNKSYYFYSSSLNHFLENNNNNNNISIAIETNKSAVDSSVVNVAGYTYVDEERYPFLHTIDTNKNVLSPFFQETTTAPNLVFIVVEGLGRAFSNKGAYLGSFTPFLDSLSEKSLYWSNFLSAGGRTFAMVPSIFGSLPYLKNGFAADEVMPEHSSLLSELKQQGYKTGFYYGGNAEFDNMNIFMKKNGADVYDQKTFGPQYTKMPSRTDFSWGYGDHELSNKYHQERSVLKQPVCNVLLTLSTHNPFLINDQEKYLNLFEKRMETLGFDEAQKEKHRYFKNQYSTILYTDNAIRNFIKAYSTKPDFSNTIFIITGDHRLPEIPMSTKIDRYHVPFIIYSPLLKEGKQFASISTHLDITPSLLSFINHRNHVPMPSQASWLGSGLDTATAFRNTHAYPLMMSKHDLVDFIMDDYLLNGKDLFKIEKNMDLSPIENESEKKKLQAAFARFTEKNNKVINGAKLVPGSN